MEQNQIFIQFNLHNQQVNIPENVLLKLPLEVRRQLLGSLDNEITEATAEEILES